MASQFNYDSDFDTCVIAFSRALALYSLERNSKRLSNYLVGDEFLDILDFARPPSNGIIRLLAQELNLNLQVYQISDRGIYNYRQIQPMEEKRKISFKTLEIGFVLNQQNSSNADKYLHLLYK